MEEKKTITSGKHTFELVDHIPFGYLIWNIGKNMIDGYLPLCRLSARQPFPGGRAIEVDTLKAIQLEGAQIILAAVGYGPETPKEMEKYIIKYENQSRGYRASAAERMKKALPLMRQFEWR